ncbi:hypothetical protein KY332_03195 [Candidatus Woesearchaeota archaeon]|nr:hypothetical protein [Candidatus Woesearchaeota archaeon]
MNKLLKSKKAMGPDDFTALMITLFAVLLIIFLLFLFIAAKNKGQEGKVEEIVSGLNKIDTFMIFLQTPLKDFPKEAIGDQAILAELGDVDTIDLIRIVVDEHPTGQKKYYNFLEFLAAKNNCRMAIEYSQTGFEVNEGSRTGIKVPLPSEKPEEIIKVFGTCS